MRRWNPGPRTIGPVGLGGIFVVAWLGDAMAQQYPLPVPQPKPSAGGSLVQEMADGLKSPLVVLTQEDRRVSVVTAEGKESERPRPQQSEYHSKRQIAVRMRTEVVYPMPQIRHATATYEPIYLERTEAEQKIHATLSRPLPEPWKFNESSLRDVQETVVEQFRIPCELDARRLEDLGLDAETPVTANLVGVSLQSALRRLLDDLDLGYLVKNDTLLITTKEVLEENLETVFYPMPTACEPHDLIDLVKSTIAYDTWDTVGGPGAIRHSATANEIGVSQTQETHEQVAKFMARFDADLGLTGGNGPVMTQRVYPVRDPVVVADLEAKLVATCNAVLGEAADPAARVSSVAGKLLVQSASRPFHIYAAELVRAVNGVEVVRQDVYAESGLNSGMGMGGMGMGGGFCWVAREVYGEHDPRWIAFRRWLMNEAPVWLLETYGRHGEWFAAWLRRHPAAKAALRPLMDAVIAGGR